MKKRLKFVVEFGNIKTDGEMFQIKDWFKKRALKGFNNLMKSIDKKCKTWIEID